MLFWPAIALATGAGGYFLAKNTPESPSPKTSKQLIQSPQTQIQPRSQTQPLQIQYQPPPNAPTRTQNMVVAGGTALIVALYYYYSSSKQTKIIVNTVEETAGETQDLVRECDENNEKRIEELDKKNQDRKNELSSEIRSESRAQFQVIGNQLRLLADVSIETLKQVANGIVRGDDNELTTEQDMDLLDVVNEYEQQSSINMSQESYLQAREDYLKDVQQEITQRELNKNNNNKNKVSVTEMTTPGGPEFNTPGGPDSSNSKDNYEKSFITNVTNAFSKKNTTYDKTEENGNSYTGWVLTKVGGTPYKYYTNAHQFYKEYDQQILLATIAVGTYFGFSKLSSFIWPDQNKQEAQLINVQS